MNYKEFGCHRVITNLLKYCLSEVGPISIWLVTDRLTVNCECKRLAWGALGILARTQTPKYTLIDYFSGAER